MRTSDFITRTNLAASVATWAGLMYTATVGNLVTLRLGVFGATSVVFRESPYALPVAGPVVFIGSSQTLAYRQLPLVEVHVSRRFSVDASASWGYEVNTGHVGDELTAGFAYSF